MRRKSARPFGRAAALVAVRVGVGVALLGAVACDAPERDTSAPVTTAPSNDAVPPDESGRAHPFAADAPDGYQLVSLGRGTWGQSWGDDSGGNDSPFTVLGDGVRTVEVSVVGYEGFQGGADLGALYRFGSGDWQRFEVDGDTAAYLPESTPVPDVPSQPAQLLVVRGDDLAVRLVGFGLARSEMIDLEATVEPSADHGTAPVVSDPPSRWSVVGSVDAEVLGAVELAVFRTSPVVTGPASGYGAGWLSEEAPLSAVPLTVVSLDGDVADLDALVPTREWNDGETSVGRTILVAGRAGVVLDLCRCTGYVETSGSRVVMTHDEMGALVVVSSPTDGGPSEQELIAVAASVRPVDRSEWGAAVEQARVTAAGGPGLHPDAGRVEIGQGVEGDVGWLLQTEAVAFDPSFAGADPCLKLSNYTRACAGPRGGLSGDIYSVAAEGDAFTSVGSFVVVTTTETGGTAIRATTSTGTGTGELFPIPGSDRRSAVVFVPGAGTAVCDPDPSLPPDLVPMRLDLIDSTGATLSCLGEP